MVNDTVYRVVWLYADNLEVIGTCIQKLEAPYTAWESYSFGREEWIENQYCYVQVASIGADGVVHMLIQGYDEDGDTGFYLGRWDDEEGYRIDSDANTDFQESLLEHVTVSYTYQSDQTYLVNNEGVFLLSEDLQQQAHWIDTGTVMQFCQLTEQKLYLCGSSVRGDFQIWKWNRNTPLFSGDGVSMDYNGKAVFAGETKGYLCTTEGIWEFDINTNEMEQVLSFVTSGFQLNKICGGTALDDGNLLLLVEEKGKKILLHRKREPQAATKVQLEFAAILPSPFLRRSIAEYNRQQSNCEIILREPSTTTEFSDFRSRIQAELSSGKGPDLLQGDVFDLRTISEKGFLVDLSNEFTQQREGMSENLQKVGKVGETYYGIPYSFGVQTLVVDGNMVKDTSHWTVDEMMKSISQSNAKVAISGYDSSSLFCIMLLSAGINGEFIDLQTKTCNLSDEKTKSVITFAEQYGDLNPWENFGLRLAEGEIFSEAYLICNMTDIQLLESLFQGRETYIGFPVGDSQTQGNGRELVGETISINQACQYPQEALDFIAYLLSADSQEQLAEDACEAGGMGFSVESHALEMAFRRAQSKICASDFVVSYGGYEYTQQAISENSLLKVRALFEQAQPQSDDSQMLWTILEEETSAYFAHSKSLEEVCQTIQNRVQLYLDEMVD